METERLLLFAPNWKSIRRLIIEPTLFALLISVPLHVRILRVVLNPVVRTIHPTSEALRPEGIGAVLTGLKPVLLLANHTHVVISTDHFTSGHGYNFTSFLRFHPFSNRFLRVGCNLPKRAEDVIADIAAACGRDDFSALLSPDIFNYCNTISVRKYLEHPRSCLRATEKLVRNFTKFGSQAELAEKQDVCVLRRGGDVEKRILAGKGNHCAMDEERLLPLLRNFSQQEARVVVATETNLRGVKEAYEASVFSNKEKLGKVVPKFMGCKSLFVASCSSFAATMMQITHPAYVVYMESRKGFEFNITMYQYKDYGDNAVSLQEDPQEILDLCGRED